MSWSECMQPKLVSADSLQTVIGVGCDDTSMQEKDSFIPEQYTGLERWGAEKNTCLYKKNYLSVGTSGRCKEYYTIHSTGQQVGKGNWACFICFSHTHIAHR